MCGSRIDDDSVFCVKCGHRVSSVGGGTNINTASEFDAGNDPASDAMTIGGKPANDESAESAVEDKFNDEDGVEAVVAVPTQDGMKKCPRCGKEQRLNRTVCWNCGIPFVSENTPQRASALSGGYSSQSSYDSSHTRTYPSNTHKYADDRKSLGPAFILGGLSALIAGIICSFKISNRTVNGLVRKWDTEYDSTVKAMFSRETLFTVLAIIGAVMIIVGIIMTKRKTAMISKGASTFWMIAFPVIIIAFTLINMSPYFELDSYEKTATRTSANSNYSNSSGGSYSSGYNGSSSYSTNSGVSEDSIVKAIESELSGILPGVKLVFNSRVDSFSSYDIKYSSACSGSIILSSNTDKTVNGIVYIIGDDYWKAMLSSESTVIAVGEAYTAVSTYMKKAENLNYSAEDLISSHYSDLSYQGSASKMIGEKMLFGSLKTDYFFVGYMAKEQLEDFSRLISNNSLSTQKSSNNSSATLSNNTNNNSYNNNNNNDNEINNTYNNSDSSIEDYILPYSSSRLLSDNDLNGLTAWECRIAINEIYARHGMRFDDQVLQPYFDGKTWYNGYISISEFDESVFSSIEDQNIKTIRAYQKSKGYDPRATESNTQSDYTSSDSNSESIPETSTTTPIDSNQLSESEFIPENSTTTEIDMTLFNGTDGDLKWSINFETGVLVITGNGNMRKHNKGDYPWYKCWSKLEHSNYQLYCSIKTIIIEEGVTSIEQYAFCNFNTVNDIKLPNTINSIGWGAFSNTKITSIVIPEGMSVIGSGAFHACYYLSNVSIPDSIKRIEYAAFGQCKSLSSIIIPEGVTCIGSYVFSSCDSLSEITLPVPNIKVDGTLNPVISSIFGEESTPDSLKKITITGKGVIKQGSLGSFPKIEIIEIKNGITGIGEENSYGKGVFSNCNNLKTVILPDSLTTICNYAFSWCENLSSISWGNNIESIGTGSFNGCKNLKSIVLPDSVKTIGNYAFSRCNSLTEVTIPDSVTSVGVGAFGHCTSLNSVSLGNGITIISDDMFNECTGITTISVPKSIVSIGNGAFSYCTSLSTITIWPGLTTIGDSAFSSCLNLSDVYYYGTEDQWNLIHISNNSNHNSPLYNATIHYNQD